MVLSKIRRFTSTPINDATYTNVNLQKNYRILNYDGTLGSIVNNISLRNNEGVIFIKIDQPPTVDLNSPIDLSISNNGVVTFDCSAQDDVGLLNLTLYHDINGWDSIYSEYGSGSNINLIYSQNNISSGTYIWNCLAYDSLNQFTFGIQNYTLIVERVSTIEIISPTENQQFIGQSVDVQFENQFFDINGIAENHLNIYLDNDNISYQFYNGGVNSIFYNGSVAGNMEWLNNRSFRVNNLEYGLHNLRLILSYGNNTELTNIEAADTVDFETMTSAVPPQPPTSGPGGGGGGGSPILLKDGGEINNTQGNATGIPLGVSNEFKLDVELIKTFISFGNDLDLNVIVHNLNPGETKEIELRYKIMDNLDNVLYEESEIITVTTSNLLLKSFDVSNLGDGEYKLIVDLVSESQLLVSEEKDFAISREYTGDILIWILISFSVIAIFFIFLYLIHGIFRKNYKNKRPIQNIRKVYK